MHKSTVTLYELFWSNAENSKFLTLGGSICFDESDCGNKIEIYDTLENRVYEKRIQNHVNVNFASAVLV